MKTWHLALAALGAIVAACFLSFPMLKAYAMLEIRDGLALSLPDMEASVKVHVGGGHGSGVHIGNGDILTAAHVVGKAETVVIEYFGGSKVEAEVLWSDRELDIALLHVGFRPEWKQSYPLDCSPNYVGQYVMFVGNPMDTFFVYTRGEVVGTPRAFGPWKLVVPVDGAVIYGQSGGGVIDENGNTVGITVGLMATPYGIAAFAYFVPAEIICQRIAEA